MKLFDIIKNLLNHKHKTFIVKVNDFIYDTLTNKWVYVYDYDDSENVKAFILSNNDYCTYDGWSLNNESFRYRSSIKENQILPVIKYNDIIAFKFNNKYYKGYYENYKNMINDNISNIRYFDEVIKTQIK